MYKKKKSQLTIIIIAAVALLLIASFFLFSAKQATQTTSSKQTKQAHTAGQDFSKVTSFVQSCLDSSLKHSLETIGQQGGSLLVAGIEGRDYIKNGPYTIPYGIVIDEYSPNKNPPKYPALAMPFGPQPNPSHIAAPSGITKLLPIGRFEQNLESAALRHFTECSTFNQFLDEGISVSTGELQSELIIGVSNIGTPDVRLTITYPLTMHNTLTSEQSSQSKFSTSQSIRLAQMHEEMQRMLSKDSSDITFDISTNILPSGMSITIENDAHEHNDIITLKDSQSSLNGKSYELKIARQNRKPALHYLPQRPNNPSMGITIATDAEGTITATLSQNTLITKSFIITNIINTDLNNDGTPDSFQATDPDEDAFSATSFTFVSKDAFSGQNLETTAIELNDLNPRIEAVITVTDGEFEDHQTIIIQKPH